MPRVLLALELFRSLWAGGSRQLRQGLDSNAGSINDGLAYHGRHFVASPTPPPPSLESKDKEPMNDPPKVGFVELRMFHVTAGSRTDLEK